MENMEFGSQNQPTVKQGTCSIDEHEKAGPVLDRPNIKRAFTMNKVGADFILDSKIVFSPIFVLVSIADVTLF